MCCQFQENLNLDIKSIKASSEMLTTADKTLNFYKITKENYEPLLHNSITKTCKISNANVKKTIMQHCKKTSSKKDILSRIPVHGKVKCFKTLKDHQPNFENKTTTKLINPAKIEVGRLSKTINIKINNQLRHTLHIQQWNNSKKVIHMFKNIQHK